MGDSIAAAGPPILVVHAGAGEWSECTDAALAACTEALEAGAPILCSGGSALDAVTGAVRALETNPWCNAGTGAVLTSTGALELDASIMDGSSLRSGAVGALPPFEHPIDVARTVLEDGRYHLLVGDGAARFAEAHGFSRARPDEMIVERRKAELLRGAQKTGNTVGAVARDDRGRLASATSTGGIMGTEPGRLGDTPIVGAGTYANTDAACSCTGDGEAFARACAAFRCATTVSRDAQSAAEETLAVVARLFGGRGGLILLGADGGVGIARTATEMPHGIALGSEDFVLGT